jgi:hypothetical protein
MMNIMNIVGYVHARLPLQGKVAHLRTRTCDCEGERYVLTIFVVWKWTCPWITPLSTIYSIRWTSRPRTYAMTSSESRTSVILLRIFLTKIENQLPIAGPICDIQCDLTTRRLWTFPKCDGLCLSHNVVSLTKRDLINILRDMLYLRHFGLY